MRTPLRLISRLLAMTAALLAAAPAHADLRDHGPAEPVLVWPQWYRDTLPWNHLDAGGPQFPNGVPLQLCKSQEPSPNGFGAPMCFPIVPWPSSFTGNVGDEIFYGQLGVNVTGPNFVMRYDAAVEAAYVPGPHPAHGQEVVFTRLRFTINNLDTAGTYVVTHPFGIDVFPDVQVAGRHSLFETIDVPLGVPGDFEGALRSRVGPFIRWDRLNAGETLTVTKLDGTKEYFLGDPNTDHTYTGSPFGTNYVRVDGPPGSNLDGAGNDFLEQPFGAVLGQVYTAPIATPFAVQKSTYSRGYVTIAGVSTQVNSMDVWATSAAGQTLVVSGNGMPSLKLQEFPGGNYYGHIEEPGDLVPPPLVTVTNLTSNPVSSKTVQLTDQVDAVATFDTASRVVTVAATSSDQSAHTLAVVGYLNASNLPTMTHPVAPSLTHTFSSRPLGGNVEPPTSVTVQSDAGGVYQATVHVVPSGTLLTGLPTASGFIATVSGSGSTTIPLSGHVTVGGGFTALVMTQPATGTAVASGGSIVYTPRAGASGADSFTYAVQDSLGISNVATISFVVPFIAPPPIVNPDNFATQANTTRLVGVLANDVAGANTTINPESVQIASGAASGTGAGASYTAGSGGLVTYRAGGAAGNFTFTYTVANNSSPATRSSPATVTMVVFGGPESASLSKVTYDLTRNIWTIVGSTNWFSTSLTQGTVSCWTSTSTGARNLFIGSGPIDTTGKWQIVTAANVAPRPTNGSPMQCQTSYGAIARANVTAK